MVAERIHTQCMGWSCSRNELGTLRSHGRSTEQSFLRWRVHQRRILWLRSGSLLLILGVISSPWAPGVIKLKRSPTAYSKRLERVCNMCLSRVKYRWSSSKRPSQKFEKVVVTRAGRVRECALAINRPFPSSSGPLFQNEGRCSAFDMEIIFHAHANKTHFHKKGCAPSLILKVRVLELGRGLLTKIFNTARDIAGDVN